MLGTVGASIDAMIGEVGMGGKLEDKVALITGAAQGQGRAHAVRLAQEGADLILLDLCEQDPTVAYAMGTADGLARTAKLAADSGARVVAERADVRELDSLAAVVDAAVAQLGRLDIVVANAAICTSQPWDEVTPAVWNATLATNLTGAWYTCQVTAPHLIAAGGGSVILVSSAAGLRGKPYLLPYVVSKHGMVGLMRALANELGPANIRVNSIHPGGVETSMGDGAQKQMAPLIAAHPESAGFFATALPDARMQPEDISPTIVYLASDDSRFVTGCALPVDAGSSQH
jgi:SDR family mycofactocin-dependent oxidoreductase